MNRLRQGLAGAATCILLLALGLFAGPALAADNPVGADQEQADSDAEELDSQASAEDTENPDAEEEESPGRFIPTEEISQDLGVSFPVDI